MAISSSGAVSFANIQTEYGGSNPISLSEYYSGSLPSNSSTTVITPTVTSHVSTYTETSGKSSITAYRYRDGFCHASLNSNFSGTTQSITVNKFSGVDKTGNSGAIPSSGAIDMNKFRGTNAGTNNPMTLLGLLFYRDTEGLFSSNLYIYVSGHVGTAGVGNITTFGLPFVSLACAAEGNTPATILYNNAQSSGNGVYAGHFGISHQNNAALGNFTVCSMAGSHTNSQVGGFSGTWTITVNH